MFCLTFHVHGLLSIGGKIVVPLASGVCLLVDEVGPWAYADFSVGDDCCLPSGGWNWVLSLWWAELGLIPLVGRLCQGVSFEVVVRPV